MIEIEIVNLLFPDPNLSSGGDWRRSIAPSSHPLLWAQIRLDWCCIPLICHGSRVPASPHHLPARRVGLGLPFRIKSGCFWQGMFFGNSSNYCSVDSFASSFMLYFGRFSVTVRSFCDLFLWIFGRVFAFSLARVIVDPRLVFFNRLMKDSLFHGSFVNNVFSL